MRKTKLTSLLCCILCLLPSASCGSTENREIKYEYGVFLGVSDEKIDDMLEYKKIVLDAQYFSAEDIQMLKNTGHTVYSYINIGSIEDFRPYYKDHERLTLGDYENWEEEKWVDVSDTQWQAFIADELSADILGKGVDGLFVDNTDVYYHYPTQEIFDGVTEMLRGFKDKGTYVIINGGDKYVTDYLNQNGNLDDIMDAVNQETVFSKINWEDETFSANDDSEKAYFKEYAETVGNCGKDVYLLEYTKDKQLIEKIAEYCENKGFTYYAAETIELEIPKTYNGAQKIKTPSEKN